MAIAYATVALIGYEQWLGAAAVVVLVVARGAEAGTTTAVQAGVIVILIVGPTASEPAPARLRLQQQVTGALIPVAVAVSFSCSRSACWAGPASTLRSARSSRPPSRTWRAIRQSGPVPEDLERLRGLPEPT